MEPLLVLAPDGGLTAAIGAAAIRSLGGSDAARAAVVDAIPPLASQGFDQVDDEGFEMGFVSPAIALADALRVLPSARTRVVLVGSVAYLGDWEQLTGSCLGGFAIGLMRSFALERRGVACINMLALPVDARVDDAGLVADAARMVAALLATGGATGQVLPFDMGGSLRMSKAGRRVSPTEASGLSQP